MRVLAVLVTTLALAGCAHTKAPEVVVKTRTVDTGCEWARAIYVSRADVLTDGTAKQIRDHNEAGAARCGWKPTKRAQ